MNDFEMQSNLNIDVNAGDVTQGIFGNIFNSRGTNECGARPTCMGWSDGCKLKLQQYYDCTKTAQTSKSQMIGGVLKVAVIGAIVLGVIIIMAISNNNKR